MADARRDRRGQAFLARRAAVGGWHACPDPAEALRRDDAVLLHSIAMTTALYPGSFDPITYGHIDVIGRATTVFDKVVVGVLINPKKSPLLSLDQRTDVIREAISEELPDLAGRIDVAGFDGLTVDFALQIGADFIVRGLRAISDFES